MTVSDDDEFEVVWSGSSRKPLTSPLCGSSLDPGVTR